MLYGSWASCLSENGPRRTERAMVRAMCGVKLMDKKRTKDLMELLGLEETKANAVRWCGHVLGSEDGHVLRSALEFEVKGRRRRGRPKRTLRKQVEEENRRVGLKKDDAQNRDRWCRGVREIATKVR